MKFDELKVQIESNGRNNTLGRGQCHAVADPEILNGGEAIAAMQSIVL